MAHQTGTQMSPRCTHMPPPTIKDWTLLQPAVSGRLTVPSVRTTLLPRRPQRSNRVMDGSEHSWKNIEDGSLQLGMKPIVTAHEAETLAKKALNL